MNTYSGTIVGLFSNPVTAGNYIPIGGEDTTPYTLAFEDDTGTAVYTGFGTDSITWGTYTGVPDPFSQVTFVGNSFTNVAPGQLFDLGTFTFSNGTSELDSLIFGATLTLSVTGGATITPEVTQIGIETTANGNPTAEQDADFLAFSQFPQTFQVLEGDTAHAELYGMIVGDPGVVATTIVLDPADSGSGFIGGPLLNSHIFAYVTFLEPGVNYASELTGQPTATPYAPVALDIGNGASGVIIGTGLGDDFYLGSGHVAVDETTGANVFEFGSGLGQVHGGTGSNTFVFSGPLYDGPGGALDQIIDFHGAGQPHYMAGQDFIDFSGYGAGAHLQFVAATPGNAANQVYEILNGANVSQGMFEVQMADGTAASAPHLNGSDYQFI
jgi:hypothetical protein